MSLAKGAGVAAAVLVIQASAVGAAELSASPAGEVVIVNNNAQEAYVAGDVADTQDMENWARRVMEIVPYVPDVVLLQEVVRPSAATVARELTELSGFRFEVAVSPEDSVFVGDGDEQIVRDTAIVLNVDTMDSIGAGGYIGTRYDEQDSSDGIARTSQHAYSSVRELNGSLEVPLVSLHFPSNLRFVSDETGWSYKSEWTEQIGSFMNRTYRPEGRAHVPVIAGDFNNRRCSAAPPETHDCDVFEFWNTLTTELDYVDAVFAIDHPGEIGIKKRIDYIFGRGLVVDAASDLTYSDADKADPARFYSDHRLVWARVTEPERQ